MKTPMGWHIVKKSGIDSYVGGLTNGSDSLWFDYGRYDVDLSNESRAWYRWSEDTVNGFPAIISLPDKPGQGEVTMKIPGLTDGNRLTIWASNVKDRETVLQIFKSAIFAGSDSSRNPPLGDSKHFRRTNVDGKALFVADCESCHQLRGRVEGPKIQDLIAAKDANWLYRFFTDEDLRATDSSHQRLKRAFNNTECIKIKNMTEPDAVALFYYIKSQTR
ncbi:c-type cytochrome [Puia sp. P3]|uniref:c-type cytochrome n=1 Tax=Puia sp. P3 TaxID=3423952 RepID=UPI003D67DC8C